MICSQTFPYPDGNAGVRDRDVHIIVFRCRVDGARSVREHVKAILRDPRAVALRPSFPVLMLCRSNLARTARTSKDPSPSKESIFRRMDKVRSPISPNPLTT